MMPMSVTLHSGDLSIPEIVEYARRAEALGYDGCWVTEESGKDAFAVLALLARETSRLRLGPAIASIYSRTPTLLAMAAATLDQVSGGRAFLGLGTGGPGFVERGHGLPIARPVARMRETAVIIRRLLTGERMTHEGHFFQVREFRLRERPPRADLPIFFATMNPQTTRLAGELADGAIFNFLTPAHLAREVRGQLQEGAARSGRDPGRIQVATLAVAAAEPDSESAWNAVRRTVAFYLASRHYFHLFEAEGYGDLATKVRDAWEAGAMDQATAMVPDGIVGHLTLSGSREKVRRQLEAYRDAGIYPIVYPIFRRGRAATDLHAAIEWIAAIAP
ncbi:MAG: LLM class flavin-dependent oxidoreductase [Deltaproteobacteria bacterium]|nr:LLM class flavin-dependent oxidoreductase [Deltaproteobacteria bacterium]